MIGFGRGYRLVAAVFCLLIAAATVFAASGARAEDRYPSRPITFVVPFAAGGPTDILARLIAATIGPLLGQQVVVEDVTGAGGTIGATRGARADPDGYTMVMGNLGTHAASLGIYQSLAYDPRTDFEPVILVASTPMVLVTRKTLPLHSLDETIAYAKANKGKTTMGSAGIGSISHLTLLLFNHLTGADVVHVPYRGLSEATNDLLGGQIDMLFDQVVTATPHIAQRQRESDRRHDSAARDVNSECALGERGWTAESANRRLDRVVRAQAHFRRDHRAHERRRAKSDARSSHCQATGRDRRRYSAAGSALAGCVAPLGQFRSR